MDFTLSEELQMIRDLARDFVTNELLPIESQVLVLDGQPGKRGAPIPREKASKKEIALALREPNGDEITTRASGV